MWDLSAYSFLFLFLLLFFILLPTLLKAFILRPCKMMLVSANAKAECSSNEMLSFTSFSLSLHLHHNISSQDQSSILLYVFIDFLHMCIRMAHPRLLMFLRLFVSKKTPNKAVTTQSSILLIALAVDQWRVRYSRTLCHLIWHCF